MKIDEVESDQNEAEKHKASVKNTSIYSCYFELQLDPSDFGLSREEHNAICNRALAKQLELLSKAGIQLVEEISNDDLLAKIIKLPRESPKFTTWEHCPSSTADGRLGVMRLVPRNQHTSTSEHWRAFHPDYKNRGGYHEWALPAGAPYRGRDHPKVDKDFNYAALSVEELPQYFETTVISNCYEDFCKVYSRAQQLLTPTQITRMLSRCYPMEKSQRLNTLLHKAVKNGHEPLISALLKCGEPVHHLLKIRNHRGNTVAHNAAAHNRHQVLKELKGLGANLSLQNKRKETVEDIVISRKFVACMPYCKPTNNQEDQHSSDEEQGGVSGSIKDPFFAYGDMGDAAKGKSNQTLKPDKSNSNKAFSEVMKSGLKKSNQTIKLPLTNNEFKQIMKAQRAVKEGKDCKRMLNDSSVSRSNS